MNRVLDVRRARRRRRPPPDGLAPAVSVLRWPSNRSADGVFEMFGAQAAGRFGSPSEPADSTNGENVLFVSASRRAAPDTPAVLLSLVNTSPSQAVRLSLKLAGRTPKAVAGRVLTAPPIGASDTSVASNVPEAADFRVAVLKRKIVEITVPARSVVVLTVQ